MPALFLAGRECPIPFAESERSAATDRLVSLGGILCPGMCSPATAARSVRDVRDLWGSNRGTPGRATEPSSEATKFV